MKKKRILLKKKGLKEGNASCNALLPPGLGGLLPVSTVGAWTSEMGRQACSVLGWLSPHGALTRPSRTALYREGAMTGKMPRREPWAG